MQGNLREIELNSLIGLIEFGQRTGELLIESGSGASWLIFFVQGAIAYATESPSPRSRLHDYLRDLAPQVRDLPTIPLGLDIYLNMVKFGLY